MKVTQEEKSYYLKQAKKVLQEVKKTVIGKDEVLCKTFMAILAGGHILIEDIPGVGKTTMTLSFANTLGLNCNRVQFTPDVMPSDVTGFNMFNQESGKFEYKTGAVMCNILLADEINRTSPKTQSALLQVMEEGSVTVDGITRKLPDPFIVLATQNPTGSVGTQKLPESQLDRFMVKLTLGYPELEDEISILKGRLNQQMRIKSHNVITKDELMRICEIVNQIYVDDSIYDYVARLAKETRSRDDIVQGLSPRGSLSLIAMARAEAFLRGNDYVLPSDIQYIFKDVVMHRIIINNNLRKVRVTEDSVVQGVLDAVKVPKISYEGV